MTRRRNTAVMGARRRPAKARAAAAGASRLARMLRTGATVVVAIVLAAGGFAAWQHRDLLPSFPVDGFAPVKRVLVEGPFERVDTSEVENAVLPYLTGGFFTVDLDAIRDAAEALPWVARAQVMREWPDAIHIVVTEQVAAWRWGPDGLLNDRAELFVTGTSDRPATLPQLAGPPGGERQVAELYLEMDGALSQCAQRVRRLELDERRAIRLTLVSGPVVELGRELTAMRVTRLCDVVLDAVRPRFDEVAYIDMRYTNGFAVGWRGQAATEGKGG